MRPVPFPAYAGRAEHHGGWVAVLVVVGLAAVLPLGCASRQTTEAVSDAVTDTLVPVPQENALAS